MYVDIDELKTYEFERGRGYTISSVESWRNAVLSKLDEMMLQNATSEIIHSTPVSQIDYVKVINALGPEGLANLGYGAIGRTLHTATIYAEALQQKTDAEIQQYRTDIDYWIVESLRDISNTRNLEELKIVLAKIHQELNDA